VTPEAAHLERLARRVAARYAADRGAEATLVAGSVAEGISDRWSDIDLILFYRSLPTADDLTASRDELGGTEWYPLGGAHEAGAVLEQFRVDGVACQLVHQTVDAWTAQAATVLEDHATDSPVQKALAGLHEGLVLHGPELIAELRAAAPYPEALAAAMVTSHLDVFPLWRMQEALARRDADLWQRSEIVAGLQRILAILAGVNRRWFSTFQLKKVGRLVQSFDHAPPRLAERIDAALTAPTAEAVEALRSLVADTVDIVEARLPDVDVTPLRRTLGPPIQPWSLPESES
jgi:hypothetical protein